jgi:hypothetical protein
MARMMNDTPRFDKNRPTGGVKGNLIHIARTDCCQSAIQQSVLTGLDWVTSG